MYLKVFNDKKAIILDYLPEMKSCKICASLKSRATFPLILKLPMIFLEKHTSIPFIPSAKLWEKTITGEDFAIVLKKEHKASLNLINESIFNEGLKIAVNHMLRNLRNYPLTIATILFAEHPSTRGHPHWRVISLDIENETCLACQKSIFIIEKTPNFTIFVPEIPSSTLEIAIVYSKHGATRQEIRKIIPVIIPNLLRKYAPILNEIASKPISLNLILDRNFHPIIFIREENNAETWPISSLEPLGFKIITQKPEDTVKLLKDKLMKQR